VSRGFSILRQEASSDGGLRGPVPTVRPGEVGDSGFHAWSLDRPELISSFASSLSVFLSPFHDFRRFGVRSQHCGFYKENLSLVSSPDYGYLKTLT